MIIGFTGPRPERAGGRVLPNPTYNFLCLETQKLLLHYNPEYTITGVAEGYDVYAAFVCMKNKIPFIAAVPFEGQENKWSDDSKKKYYKILNTAKQVVYVSPPGFHASKYLIRNEYIVNHSNLIIAAWNNKEYSAGTSHCVNYAEKQNKEVKKIIFNV